MAHCCATAPRSGQLHQAPAPARLVHRLDDAHGSDAVAGRDCRCALLGNGRGEIFQDGIVGALLELVDRFTLLGCDGECATGELLMQRGRDDRTLGAVDLPAANCDTRPGRRCSNSW